MVVQPSPGDIITVLNWVEISQAQLEKSIRSGAEVSVTGTRWVATSTDLLTPSPRAEHNA